MSFNLRRNSRRNSGNGDASFSLPSYGNVLVSGYGYKLGSGSGLFGQTNWKSDSLYCQSQKGTMAKRLRLYYYLKPGDKTPRGMFDLNPSSLVLKVERHSTAPAVADADHEKLYPISIFERAATKDENIGMLSLEKSTETLPFVRSRQGSLGPRHYGRNKVFEGPHCLKLTAPASSEDEDDHFDEGTFLRPRHENALGRTPRTKM